jgi:hypothetical protein
MGITPNMKITHLSFSALLIIVLTSCSTTEKVVSNETITETPTPQINDYPTQERIEYVLNCIAKHGGLTYITKYACGCKIDKIAEKLSYKEYEEARTFTFLRSTPGEKGGIFRDPGQAKDLRTRLKEAEEYAEKNCFVK